MKTMTKLSLIAAAIVASPVMAEEKASEIKTTAELGVLITTGNTESSSILGKITVDHKFGSWLEIHGIWTDLFQVNYKLNELILCETLTLRDAYFIIYMHKVDLLK